MKKESLIKIRNKIIDILHESDIDPLDKGELVINLIHFLDENSYDGNIRILREHSKMVSIEDYKNKQMNRQISIADYIKTLKKEMKPDDRRKDTKKKNNTEEI